MSHSILCLVDVDFSRFILLLQISNVQDPVIILLHYGTSITLYDVIVIVVATLRN